MNNVPLSLSYISPFDECGITSEVLPSIEMSMGSVSSLVDVCLSHTSPNRSHYKNLHETRNPQI